MTVTFGQEKMSSGSIQLSLDVSIDCPSSPGFQMNSSRLFESPKEDLSAASPNLCVAVFISLFCYSQSFEHLSRRLCRNLNLKWPGLPPFVRALLDLVLILGCFPLQGLLASILSWDCQLNHYDPPFLLRPDGHVWP